MPLLLALLFAIPTLVRAASPEVGVPTAMWDAPLAAFAAADDKEAPPPGGVLFVGSSSIRLWDGLEKDFAALPVVIKRGFGGSKLSDCVHYLDRLVIRYRPRLVLVYAGDNDLAEGKTASDVLHQFEAFVQGVRSALPETRIAFISIKPSPARASLLPEIRRANTLVEQFAATQSGVAYVDVYSPMLAADGTPRRELFKPDALHLNDSGYALWTSVISRYVN
ncbi:MAG TPA: SGNH/GDSL hydrolase family protein [Casimicrobiaceae bacterium]|jgi:lysophospholipase L1-like esterase|nr:SGNH/GDSL hydrolase family protein [Casimicrobiaceae bacterium]